jgi:membrane protein implicated in regulation of membrane protease activity
LVLTRRLALAPFVVAAALAGGVDRGGGGIASLAAFLIVALVVRLLLAPALDRTRRRTPKEETPFDSTPLVGRHAVVLERIENREGLGFVTIDGEVWTARAADGDHVIEPGAHVEVVEMKGATALVA